MTATVVPSPAGLLPQSPSTPREPVPPRTSTRQVHVMDGTTTGRSQTSELRATLMLFALVMLFPVLLGIAFLGIR